VIRDYETAVTIAASGVYQYVGRRCTAMSVDSLLTIIIIINWVLIAAFLVYLWWDTGKRGERRVFWMNLVGWLGLIGFAGWCPVLIYLVIRAPVCQQNAADAEG
jgi:hypothetical protein